VGKTAPRTTSIPTKRPNQPIGTPPNWAIGEKAELSQLKNALMSQKEPAQIDSGKLAA
jgi:hypothetical protein